MTKTAKKRGRPRTMLRPPAFALDDYGNPIAIVSLAKGGGTCTVDRADWDALLARGVSPNWYLGTSGVGLNRKPAIRTTHRGKIVQVARLILEATPNHRLVYRTSDRTDLRRVNIGLKKVSARGEGDAATGVMRKTTWVSLAKVRGPTKAQLAAERKAADNAAHAAYQAAGAERYARWMAWIESQVATGRDRQEVTTEAQEQARAERREYCAQHGLDPTTGRYPREPRKGHKAALPVIQQRVTIDPSSPPSTVA
ncbi:hypothetical protein QFZ27_000169 [Inquilinus ginsengisoli]|uniref:hypothetical protein n=1 Tax=Inquilinus ginsengisoli TaxID=363840 RepID=UPI003D23322C